MQNVFLSGDNNMKGMTESTLGWQFSNQDLDYIHEEKARDTAFAHSERHQETG